MTPTSQPPFGVDFATEGLPRSISFPANASVGQSPPEDIPGWLHNASDCRI